MILLQIAALDQTRRPGQRMFNTLGLEGPEVLPCLRSGPPDSWILAPDSFFDLTSDPGRNTLPTRYW
jgi:hypothetical protein